MPGSQKKYICSFCSKAFSRSEHKARHERSHTGVKPFECKVCRHAFVRRDLLQRHIRTVHRELLLLKRSLKNDQGVDLESASGVKNDLMIELLVNSMIQVNSDSLGATVRGSSGAGGGGIAEEGAGTLAAEPERVSSRRKKKNTKNGSCNVTDLDRDNARSISRIMSDSRIVVDVKKVSEIYHRGMDYILDKNIFVHSLASSQPKVALALTIFCVGMFVVSDDLADDVFGICWNKNLETVDDQQTLVSLNILAHLILEFNDHRLSNDVTSMRRVFVAYQQYFHSAIPSISRRVDRDGEVWFMFHIWVSLLRLSNEPDQVTVSIYRWFLQQPASSDTPLKDLIYQVLSSNSRWNLATLNLVADALFCDWLIGSSCHKSEDLIDTSFHFTSLLEVHNAIIVANRYFANESRLGPETMAQLNLVDIPKNFVTPIRQFLISVQSQSHWLLLETTWFEFIRSVNIKHDHKNWFMQSMADFPTTFIDTSMINDNLAFCCLPILPIIESPNEINPRYVSLISDVTLFLMRLFEFEMSISSNKYCPYRLIGLLTNPMIQLLLFIGYRVTSRGSASQQESIAVDHFINRYVINSDKFIHEELSTSLFDSQSLAFMGYHQLIFSITNYLRENIITNALMKLPYLDRDIKLHLFDYSQRRRPGQEFQTSRLTDTWKSPQHPVWMYSPHSSRSMSIDSSVMEHQTLGSVSMSNSNSLEPWMIRESSSNIVLPPLKINTVGRPSNEFSLTRQQPPHSTYYLYGSSDPSSNQRGATNIRSNNFVAPSNYSNMDGVLMDNGTNSSTTSPRSANGNVKLPPPSELLGLSSR